MATDDDDGDDADDDDEDDDDDYTVSYKLPRPLQPLPEGHRHK